jgi:hypothetical protein
MDGAPSQYLLAESLDAGARFFLEATTALLLVALADFHVFGRVQVTPERTADLFVRFYLSVTC